MTATAIDPTLGQPVDGAVFRSIRADQLQLDPLVNRAVDVAWVSQLARNFDPTNVGTLVVSLRADGTAVVIDGQHRKLAAVDALRPDFEFHCDVRYGLTVPEEAALFLELNKRRNVSPVDHYQKAVVAGREPEVSIAAVLDGLNLRVDKKTALRTIGGPRVLRALHAKGGDELLALTLGTALEAWPEDRDALREEVLRGLGEVLHRHREDLDLPNFVHRLQTRKTPAGLRGEAATGRGIHGGTLWTYVAESLVNVYNRGRRNHLPRWS
jgi:hypothetical protein